MQNRKLSKAHCVFIAFFGIAGIIAYARDLYVARKTGVIFVYRRFGKGLNININNDSFGFWLHIVTHILAVAFCVFLTIAAVKYLSTEKGLFYLRSRNSADKVIE